MRLPELSYRLAHHFPSALPFFVPFYAKVTQAGFSIDKKRIKPVLRRNGKRIITDYSKDGSTVTFRFWGTHGTIASIDLNKLKDRIDRIKRVGDYAKVDDVLERLVVDLKTATD